MKLFVFLSRLCAGGSLAKRSTLFLGASAAAVVLGSAARARKSYGVRPSFRPVENRSPLLSERGLRFRRRSASEEQTHFSGEKGKEFWPRGRDGWPDTHSDGRPKHSSGRPQMGSFRRRGADMHTRMRPGKTYVTCQDANLFRAAGSNTWGRKKKKKPTLWIQITVRVAGTN